MPQSILLLTKLQELSLSHNNYNGTLALGFSLIDFKLESFMNGFKLGRLGDGAMEDLRLEGGKVPQSSFSR